MALLTSDKNNPKVQRAMDVAERASQAQVPTGRPRTRAP